MRPGWSLMELEIDFILSNHELLNFGVKEIEAYLSERAPHLVPHAEAISHFSAHSTVSARLLMALMEQQTGIFGKQGASTETPFGQMSTKWGFIDQMSDVSSRVSSAYYDQGDLRQVEALSTQRALEAILPSAGERTALGQAYRKLFPGVASQRVLPRSDPSAVVARAGLQFPWKQGDTGWRTGAAHTNSGSGCTNMSSIDPTKGGSWGNVDPNIWVVAGGSGTFTARSKCLFSIVHEGGISTSYYHMDHAQFSNNAMVAQNVPIGRYADNQAQALCDGGSSTGPHVHYSVLVNGKHVPLDGHVFCGYTARLGPGACSYESDCNEFWFEKGGTKFCAKDIVNNNCPGSRDGRWCWGRRYRWGGRYCWGRRYCWGGRYCWDRRCCWQRRGCWDRRYCWHRRYWDGW